MASQVKEMPPERKQNRKYDWDSWLNGKVWKLVSGVDFNLTAHQFRHGAFVAAYAKGIRIRTRIDFETQTVYMQAVGLKSSPTKEILARAKKRRQQIDE